jgi:hypothetical protein
VATPGRCLQRLTSRLLRQYRSILEAPNATVDLELLTHQKLEEARKAWGAGNSLCFADLRGTGECEMDRDRSRNSSVTGLLPDLLMLGEPLLAGQLRDLRRVLQGIKQRPEVGPQPIKIWRDSRGPRVAAARSAVPRDDDSVIPVSVEPAGCLLALLLSLYDDSMQGRISPERSVALPVGCILRKFACHMSALCRGYSRPAILRIFC